MSSSVQTARKWRFRGSV